MPWNIANIYVSIFGKYLQFLHLVYICMIYLTLYVRFSNILFNNNMIKISGIYVGTTGYILQMINISWCRGNSQHSMSDNTYFNHISMEKYKQEILPKFMLAIFIGIYFFVKLCIICGNLTLNVGYYSQIYSI